MKENINAGESSSGRTSAFDSENLGSNPSSPSIYSKQSEHRKEYLRKYQREYQKTRYNENKSYRIKKSDELRARRRKWFDELVANLKCEDCGFAHPGALDFHHIDPATKDRAVTKMRDDKCPKEKILAEIKKCKVLCSNCHRILHWKERQKKCANDV